MIIGTSADSRGAPGSNGCAGIAGVQPSAASKGDAERFEIATDRPEENADDRCEEREPDDRQLTQRAPLRTWRRV